MVSAGLAAPQVPWAPDVFNLGPLLEPPTVGSLVGARCAAALHDLAAHGDDGVAAVLKPRYEHAGAEPSHDAHPHPGQDGR